MQWTEYGVGSQEAWAPSLGLCSHCCSWNLGFHTRVRSESEELSGCSSRCKSLWFWGLRTPFPLILTPYAFSKGTDNHSLWFTLCDGEAWHDQLTETWLWPPKTSWVWSWLPQTGRENVSFVKRQWKTNTNLQESSPSSSLSQPQLCERMKPYCLRRRAECNELMPVLGIQKSGSHAPWVRKLKPPIFWRLWLRWGILVGTDCKAKW